MFSTVRAKELGSITRSKKEIGVLAGDGKKGLLKNQTGGIHRPNICKHKVRAPFKS